MVIRPMSTNSGDMYALLQALVYRIFSVGGLTNSVGTNTRPKTVNTVQFCAQSVNGQAAPIITSLAATDPLPVFPAAFTNLAAGQACRVRIEVDKAGTVTYKQGNVAANLGLAQIPRRSAGLATLGWIEIAVAAGFTFGTTSLGSAGVTFFDGDPDLGGLEGVPPSDRGVSTDVVSAP